MRSRIRRELVAVVALRDEPLRILHEHRAELLRPHEGLRARRRSGATPRRRASGSRWWAYRLRFAATSSGSSSRRSRQSDFGWVGCPVSSEYALTFIVNCFGVRSTQVRASCGEGGK